MNQHKYRYPSTASLVEWEPRADGEGRVALIGHYTITEWYRPALAYQTYVIETNGEVIETYYNQGDAIRHLYNLALEEAPAKVADLVARLQEENAPHEISTRPSSVADLGITFWSVHTRSACGMIRAYANYAHQVPTGLNRVERTSTRFVGGRVIGLRRTFGARLAFSMLKTVAQIGRDREPVEA
jgi:hypothetical protein